MRALVTVTIVVGVAICACGSATAESGLDRDADAACDLTVDQFIDVVVDKTGGDASPLLDVKTMKAIAKKLAASKTAGAKRQGRLVAKNGYTAMTDLDAVMQWCRAAGFVPSGAALQSPLASILQSVDAVLAIQGSNTDPQVVIARTQACAAAIQNAQRNLRLPGLAERMTLWGKSDEIPAALSDFTDACREVQFDRTPLAAARARFVAAFADVPELNLN
jgi:hypothetical protein